MYRGWTQTDYQNKRYNINQKDEGTYDDRGRDGGTNFILRIKNRKHASPFRNMMMIMIFVFAIEGGCGQGQGILHKDLLWFCWFCVASPVG